MGWTMKTPSRWTGGRSDERSARGGFPGGADFPLSRKENGRSRHYAQDRPISTSCNSSRARSGREKFKVNFCWCQCGGGVPPRLRRGMVPAALRFASLTWTIGWSIDGPGMVHPNLYFGDFSFIYKKTGWSIGMVHLAMWQIDFSFI